MPLRHGTGAAASSVPDIWRRGMGGANSNLIDHMYRGTGPNTYTGVYSRAVLPSITSFTLTPDNATAASAATLAAEYTVAGVTTQGRTYNYGARLTTQSSSLSTDFRIGWSQTHGFGTVTPGNQSGNLTFICYFHSTPSQTVGDDLNRRYFVRTNFSSGPDYTNRKTATTLSVNGVDYPLSARGSSGWTTAQDVPEWTRNQTYNVQVTFSDGTTAWPNTQSATVAGTTTYPTVEIIQTLASGPTTTFASTAVPSGTVTITRPNEDASYNFVATNAAGSAHVVRHFDFRQAPTGLALTLVSQTPDANFADDTLLVRAAFTADPATATIEAAGLPTISGVTNGSTHRILVARQSGSVRNITFTLRVRGVNTSNQPYPASGAEATATLAVTIPRRGAGG